MGASSIWIDRPIEREELSGDVVDHRFRFDLDELDPSELRGVEGPPADLEQGLPFHWSRIEHTFDGGNSGSALKEPAQLCSHLTRRTTVPGDLGVPSWMLTPSMTAVMRRMPRPEE